MANPTVAQLRSRLSLKSALAAAARDAAVTAARAARLEAAKAARHEGVIVESSPNPTLTRLHQLDSIFAIFGSVLGSKPLYFRVGQVENRL
jgi:hypothetical protein